MIAYPRRMERPTVPTERPWTDRGPALRPARAIAGSGALCLRLLVAILAAVPLSAANADASVEMKEFPLPTAGHRPQAIVAGADGNIWVTEVLTHEILRMTPDGSLTEYRIPGARVGVIQGIAAGPDGRLWFTSREENSIRAVTRNGDFAPAQPITSVAESDNGVTKGSWPRVIIAGQDGALWFTEMAANKIARISVQGAIAEFDIQTARSQPYGIAWGSGQPGLFQRKLRQPDREILGENGVDVGIPDSNRE